MFSDSFGRDVTYIRVSVIDKCNFRCQYCMPNTPDDFFKNEQIVPFNKLINFLYFMIENGVQKIRFTGGEPLLRDDLPDLISKICLFKKNIDIAITTNGSLLSKYAKALKKAGLKRINISLDTLNKNTLMFLSKRAALDNVLKGIEAALKEKFIIKINMVPLKNINDNEILDILEFAKSKQISVRFIEFMENQNAKDNIKGLKEEEILKIIKAKYKIKNEQKSPCGPANLYTLQDDYLFGIIAPHKDTFCKSCNRIRLSSDGTIVPCLYYEDGVNIKKAMFKNDKEGMREALIKALQNKPESNKWSYGMREKDISFRAFYKTGG